MRIVRYFLFCSLLFSLVLMVQNGCKSPSKEGAKLSDEEVKAAIQKEPDTVNFVLKTAESYFLQMDYTQAKKYFKEVKELTNSKTIKKYVDERLEDCDVKIKAMPFIEPEPKPEPPTVDWWNNLDEDWQKVLNPENDYIKGEADQKEVTFLFENRLMITFPQKDIKDLEPLRPLKKMQVLICTGTKITSLEPLSEHKKMLTLRFANTQVTSLEPVAQMTKLQDLRCSFTGVTSLDPIKPCINLRFIDAASTKINNIDALYGMHLLIHLDFSNTKVSSLEPLRNIGALETLYCINTPISDLQPLSKLGLLRILNISGTKVTSLAPLDNLKKLEKLYCKSTAITPDEVARFKSQHPTCEVIY